ncbi:hypothetical protein HK098_007980 [Nowakowskiella sp. JEL0407]|nr:hypothetical protein HK098_007980 [Nowakowskiella sp. JEL0407]
MDVCSPPNSSPFSPSNSNFIPQRQESDTFSKNSRLHKRTSTKSLTNSDDSQLNADHSNPSVAAFPSVLLKSTNNSQPVMKVEKSEFGTSQTSPHHSYWTQQMIYNNAIPSILPSQTKVIDNVRNTDTNSPIGQSELKSVLVGDSSTPLLVTPEDLELAEALVNLSGPHHGSPAADSNATLTSPVLQPQTESIAKATTKKLSDLPADIVEEDFFSSEDDNGSDDSDKTDGSYKVRTSRSSTKRPKLSKEQRPKSEFICEICHRAFSRKFNLQTHVETHNEHRDRAFRCEKPACGRTFVRIHDLERHLRIHDSPDMFQCPTCGKGFSRKDALKRHIRTAKHDPPSGSPEVEQS